MKTPLVTKKVNSDRKSTANPNDDDDDAEVAVLPSRKVFETAPLQTEEEVVDRQAAVSDMAPPPPSAPITAPAPIPAAVPPAASVAMPIPVAPKADVHDLVQVAMFRTIDPAPKIGVGCDLREHSQHTKGALMQHQTYAIPRHAALSLKDKGACTIL